MPGVQDIVRTSKRGFADWLTELAKQAGAADPRQLGNQLAVLYEGAAALRPRSTTRPPWASRARDGGRGR